MCIQGVQDRAQYTALGGSNVQFNGCRFVEANLTYWEWFVKKSLIHVQMVGESPGTTVCL